MTETERIERALRRLTHYEGKLTVQKVRQTVLDTVAGYGACSPRRARRASHLADAVLLRAFQAAGRL